MEHFFGGPYPINLNATDVPIRDRYDKPYFYPPVTHVLLGAWLFLLHAPSVLGIGPVRACILWASILDWLSIFPTFLIVRRFSSFEAATASAFLWAFNAFSFWAFRWGGLGLLTIGFFASATSCVIIEMLSQRELNRLHITLYSGALTLTLCAAFLSHPAAVYFAPVMGLTISILACTSIGRRKVSILIVSFLASIGLAFAAFYSYALFPLLSIYLSAGSAVVGKGVELWRTPPAPLFPATWYWIYYGTLPLLLSLGSPLLIKARQHAESVRILPLIIGFFATFLAAQLSVFGIYLITRVQFLVSIYSAPIFGIVFDRLGFERRFGIIVLWAYTVFHSLLIGYVAFARLWQI